MEAGCGSWLFFKILTALQSELAFSHYLTNTGLQQILAFPLSVSFDVGKSQLPEITAPQLYRISIQAVGKLAVSLIL
jgi:hypothetical protein